MCGTNFSKLDRGGRDWSLSWGSIAFYRMYIPICGGGIRENEDKGEICENKRWKRNKWSNILNRVPSLSNEKIKTLLLRGNAIRFLYTLEPIFNDIGWNNIFILWLACIYSWRGLFTFLFALLHLFHSFNISFLISFPCFPFSFTVFLFSFPFFTFPPSNDILWYFLHFPICIHTTL